LCLTQRSISNYLSSISVKVSTLTIYHSMASTQFDLTRILTSSESVADCEHAVGKVDAKATLLTARSQSFMTEKGMNQSKWCAKDSYGQMSPASFVVNMLADLCPGGVMPLAYGMNWAGYAPAAVFLLVLTPISIYTMWVIAQTAEITGTKTWKEQWEKVVSPKTAWIPVTVLVLFCYGCNLLYSSFFSDLFAAALPPLGIPLSRDQCLVVFTLFPLLPLCLKKDLYALTFSSSLSMIMILFTAFVTVLRAVDGTYVSGGAHYASLLEKPLFPRSHMYSMSTDSLVLMNFISMAFVSHYNGNKYYRELEGHTPKRFAQCTSVAMGITGVFYGIMMFAGYYTFGMTTQGVILDNYAPEDMLANMARVGIAFSMLASFPIMFSGLREAVIDLILIVRPSLAEDVSLCWSQNALNVCLLTTVTVSAAIFTNVVEVVGFIGAICGSVLIYIMPPLLYAKAIEKFLLKEDHALEIACLKTLACFGVVMMVSGLTWCLS